MAKDSNEILAEAIHMLIRRMSGGYGGPGQAITMNQFGNRIGMGIGNMMTGDPALRLLLGSFAGQGMGKFMSGMFPGMSGGLNVNDSILRQMQRQAHTTLIDTSKKSIDDLIAQKKADYGRNILSPFFGIAADLTGIRSIASGMDPALMGYQVPIGMPGGENKFISSEQHLRNRMIYNKLYGSKGNKGLLNRITDDYLSDTSAFGGMTGTEVGMIAGDRMSRGLDNLGDDDKEISRKIQKAARSIKSIRDIIAGPLKEVVAQMEKTFGSGYLNTFGAGGAADMVNRMRAVGSMGGFSTRQIMALAPATTNMIEQAGGNKVSSGLASSLTGIIMGLTRAKDKNMVDEGKLTQNVVKTVVGAQQSRMGRSISSAESLITDKKKLEEFRKKVRAKAASGETITTDWLAEQSGVSAETILNNRNSIITEEMMGKSSLGAETSIVDQSNKLFEKRKRAAIAVMGREKYNELLARKGKENISERELIMNTRVKDWGIDKNNQVAVAGWFNVYKGSYQNYAAQNLGLGNAKEMVARNAASKSMGKLYSDSAYGAGLGVNLWEALKDKDHKGGLSEALKTLFNVKKQGVAGKHFTRLLNESTGSEAASKKALEEITKEAEELGLTGEEAAKYIEENVMKVITYKGKKGGPRGWEGYKTSKDYKDRKEKIRDTIGKGMSGDKFDEAYEDAKEAALDKKREKLGRNDVALNPTELKEVKRKLHIKQIDADMAEQEAALEKELKEKGKLSKKDELRLKTIKKFRKKTANHEISDESYDEELMEIKDDMDGTVDGAIKKLESSEKDIMTALATFLMERLPAYLDAAMEWMEHPWKGLTKAIRDGMPSLGDMIWGSAENTDKGEGTQPGK